MSLSSGLERTSISCLCDVTEVMYCCELELKVMRFEVQEYQEYMLRTFWGNVSGISLPSNEANGLLNLLSVPTISSYDGGAGAAATIGISILPKSSVI